MFGGLRLWSRSKEGSRFGVKVLGWVKVGGSRLWSRSWGQGQGYDQWSQSRGQCRGSKSGVIVRGSISGGVGHGQGMRVKVWGVGVRWSVGFIQFHSNPFHVLPNAGQSRAG